MFDFYKYVEAFNSGDDRAMLDRFWVDDLVVCSARGKEDGVLASGKEGFLKFLEFAHDGVREIMRIQVLIQNKNNIFAEIDMDFHASKDRPDYPFGPLQPGDFITVKMFCLYFLRGDRIEKLKMASWAPNVGITDPPTRGFGPPPPIQGGVRKIF
ncbi:MAG TPA: hypothetical protein VJ377_09960 [Dehalococcoidales bacterium]|nr:MAG: hypothetical protein A2Z05_01805 [Chloroflexi bacterium RBG_16_60_22]HJX13830.1 hypothetical protein [Dehalococcoidales bacterium]